MANHSALYWLRSLTASDSFIRPAPLICGASLVFLQGLVLFLLVIDPVAGGNIVKRLYPWIVDVQFLEWLEQVSKMVP